MNDSQFELYSVRDCWYNESRPKLKSYVEEAAQILSKQWPRGGTASDYKRKLLGSDSNMAGISTNHDEHLLTTLPCSYLLLQNTKRMVGHGRLTECFEGRGGNAVAATYIITEPRGQGHGTMLMSLLEQEAVRLGYHYMYLWTTTALPFYNKLGYSKTERVSLHSACLKTLESQQVGTLETMLAKRNKTSSQFVKETVTLPPDTSCTDKDVWLRKRLVESIPSKMIPFENRMNELQAAIQQNMKSFKIQNWKYFYRKIPWQQQIGPSCGLVALNMLHEYYYEDKHNNILTQHQEHLSLLLEAQTKGYSVDGEIFNFENMIKLADYWGLRATLRKFHTISALDMLNLIMNDECTFIVPYDSQPFSKLPFANNGKSAHYGIVVGMLVGLFNCIDQGDVDKSILTPTVTEIIDWKDVCENCKNTTQRAFLLLTQHGLSPNWSIASYDEFLASNQQLNSIDTMKYNAPENDVYSLSNLILTCHGKN